MAEKLPINYANLKDKSIIITGGASGLGLATATRFAEHGAYVTIADVNGEEGQKAAGDLASQGHHVTFVQVDVRDWSSSVTAFKHAVNFSPRKTLDGAFLFAGLAGDKGNLAVTMQQENPQATLDVDPVEPSTTILDVNLGGLLKSAKLALYYFRLPAAVEGAPPEPEKKTLFLVASLAAYFDYDSTHYCVSKYGVRGLFRSLRLASRQPDSMFTVNLVAPGYTLTPLVTRGAAEDANEGRRAAINYVTKMGLWAPVEHVVDCASLCATNADVNGRSFGTWPHGWFDQMEDLDEGYGGMRYAEHAETSGMRKSGLLKG